MDKKKRATTMEHRTTWTTNNYNSKLVGLQLHVRSDDEKKNCSNGVLRSSYSHDAMNPYLQKESSTLKNEL
ncbi:hypothetical protein GALMADRAFT_243810 [Galerina marginata CBS 339.88]|uniref:Uncharacterized protein n=1 Tax=Galerina marginata (strain CBS 339.88) TaxID=685588 RepID=A0A067T7Z3_GALM3|nr:hypothetical protein GALMADRAFT_243810 [Galerina marginata CBS 339.88]